MRKTSPRSYLLPVPVPPVLLLLLLFLAFAVSRSSGQQTVTPMTDPFEYATGLASRGYFDLAFEVLDDALRDPEIADDRRISVRFARAILQKRRADRQRAFDRKLVLYREASNELEALLDDVALRIHPRYLDSVLELADLARREADVRLRAIEAEASEAKIKELRADGVASLVRARKRVDSVLDLLEAIGKASRTEAQEDLLMRARYYAALGEYALGRLHPDASFEKVLHFKEAAKLLEEYAWDYASFGSGQLAMLFLGKVHADWARVSTDDRREVLISTALDLIRGVTEQARQRETLRADAWYMGLVQRAVYEEAKLLNSLGRHPECVEVVRAMTEMLAKAPAGELVTEGYAANVELATALEEIGELEESARLSAELAMLGEGTEGERLMSEKLAETLLRMDGHATAGFKPEPDWYFTAAMGLRRKGDWARSVEFLQRMLRAGELTGRTRENEIEAWTWIGRGYTKMGDHFAAGIAHETAATRFDAPAELVEENAILASRAYDRQYAIEKKSRRGVSGPVKDARDRMRKVISSIRPEMHGYDFGVELMREGEYDQAVVRLDKVEKSDPRYPRARLQIGACRLEMGKKILEESAGKSTGAASAQFGKLEDVRRQFADFLDDRSWPPRGDLDRTEREQAMASLTYDLARSQKLVGRETRALKWLDGFDVAYSGQPSFVRAALALEADLRIEAGQLDKAESCVARLGEKFAGSGAALGAMLALGQELKRRVRREAEERKTDVESLVRERDDARARLARSAELTEAWWSERGRPAHEGIQIAQDWSRVGEHERAREILAGVLERDTDSILGSQRRKVQSLYADTLLELKRYRDAAGVLGTLFDELIGDREGIVNLSLRRKYAIALGGTVIVEDGALVEYDGIEEFERAFEVWLPIVKTRSDDIRYGPDWWAARFHVVYMDLKLGRIEKARGDLEQLEVVRGDELRESQFRTHFEWLKRRLRR